MEFLFNLLALPGSMYAGFMILVYAAMIILSIVIVSYGILRLTRCILRSFSDNMTFNECFLGFKICDIAKK